MMVNRIISMCLMIFALGCGVGKDVKHTGINQTIVESKNDTTIVYKLPKISPDSVFVYTCKGRSFNIKNKGFNRAYFPQELRVCLEEEGFNGNMKANRYLADMILNLGMSKFTNTMNYRNVDYRGPQIFEAGLVIAEDFGLVGHPYMDIVTGTRSSSVHGFLSRMIESIDGEKDSNNWICIIYNYNGMSCDRVVGPIHDPVIRFDMEYHKLKHETIKKMWQEGKIKLKPFGEK